MRGLLAPLAVILIKDVTACRVRSLDVKGTELKKPDFTGFLRG